MLETCKLRDVFSKCGNISYGYQNFLNKYTTLRDMTSTSTDAMNITTTESCIIKQSALPANKACTLACKPSCEQSIYHVTVGQNAGAGIHFRLFFSYKIYIWGKIKYAANTASCTRCQN